MGKTWRRERYESDENSSRSFAKNQKQQIEDDIQNIPTPSDVTSPKTSEFTFNVEELNIFNNSDIGSLSLTGKMDTTFIYGEPLVYDEDDEYFEASFDGQDEVEFDIQEQVSSSQEDSDSNLSTIGTPANIKPVSGLDQLLRLAGDCARELGKRDRVNYKNLSSGYIKGVHGLCPQGTLSVLYAMTGVKSLGLLRGNANTFAMNGNQGFTSGGYYNQKVKVDKGYFNNQHSWQIGDIIANDYTNGKLYGHIQIWTGIKWVSDFTQNRLQVNNVDFNTVALHRLTQKGIEAVSKQTTLIN